MRFMAIVETIRAFVQREGLSARFFSDSHMIDWLRSQPLWRYRGLVRQLAARDLKTRYKVSVLGFFWSLLRPLLTIAVLAAVFSILKLESTRYGAAYPALLLAAYMPWFYFSAALLEGTQSLLSNAHLAKKVYCPRAVYPLSVVAAHFINFIFAMAVTLPIVYLAFAVAPSWALIQLPLAIGFTTLFLMGLCFALSVLNVLFRDTTQIVEFVAFVWFYLSPVLYDTFEIYDRLGATGAWLYFLNPMAGLLEWHRYALLASSLRHEGLAELNQITFLFGIPYAAVMSVAVFIGGYALMRRLESRAVDEL